MLKGNTKIELTDVHTGNTEVFEDTNMFTNGLKYVVNGLNQFYSTLQYAQSTNNRYNLFPIIENLLGGIMLFSNTLEENVENIYPPTKNNKMIGCANMSMNDVPELTDRGSFNENESGMNADGSYTFVWDFTTTQANGSIASLALVPNCAGINGINLKNITKSHGLQLERLEKNIVTGPYSQQMVVHNPDYQVTTYEKWIECLEKQKKENEETIGISLGNSSWNTRFWANQIIKEIDFDAGKIYCAHIEDINGNYVLFTYDIDFSTMSIGLYEHRYEMTGISNVRSMILTSANQGFFGTCVPFSGYYQIKILKISNDEYVVTAVTSSVEPRSAETEQTGASTHSVMFVNMSSKTITQQFTKTYPCWLVNNGNNVSYLPDERKIVFGCRKYDDEGNAEYYLAFVNIDDFNEISYAYGLERTPDISSVNKRAVFDGYYVGIDYGNNMVLNMNDEIKIDLIACNGPLAEYYYNTYYETAYIRDKVIVGEFDIYSGYSYPYVAFKEVMLGTVLMTINNLESQVEKTADKTMKITYTVREVEE
ncbi:MAG: hypothetical protein NC311_08750 [Muribaculaceae bacterium]|nr:hypothetical protein [Muribaculaceae bacterium]MCM1399860.1 hypothetical protein [Clostridium sp.]MCM1460655.1 hypothetical protein [Bacteroides sp.]